MNVNSARISVFEKVGYSLGDMASNLYFQTWILFLMYFYTDVFGVSAAAVGTMFLITRLWDAVNDPIMGMIADRTETKWGKFRPYLIWCALPFGIIGVFMFTTPNLDPTGKLIYAYITYTAMMMIYTAINVPYSALMGVISPNALERTEVSTYRFVAAFIAGFIVQASVLTLVKKFGGGNEATGWQWAMAVLSGFAVILFFITFFTTQERVHPPVGQKPKLSQDLKDLFRNVPWILSGITSILYLILNVMRNGCIMYYFKYFIGNQEFSLFGRLFQLSFENLAPAFMIAGSITTITGAILTKWFIKKLDKHHGYVIFLILVALTSIPYFVFQPENIILIFVTQLLVGFFMGPIAVLQWSIFTDTADYSEWKNGRRATGLIMSASMFAIKFGLALGGTLLGWLMAGYGFVPNTTQSPETLFGIRMIMSMYPAIIGFICAGVMYFYPLGNKMMEQIEIELSERRG